MTITKAYSRFLLAVLLSVTAHAEDLRDLTVISAQGDVQINVRGEPRAVQQGMLLELPAKVRTGSASSIELQQGPTTISVAANTQLEIPATAVRGEPIGRVIQPKGNAFYSVGKREKQKFRVETPYLVAVVKGTQFNVTVQDDSATVSLFEGRLEIQATDASDTVDLEAGEIAIRHAGDANIRVLRMDTGEPIAHNDSDRSNAATPPRSTSGSVRLDSSTDVDLDLVGLSAKANADPAPDASAALIDRKADVGVDTSADLSVSVNEKVSIAGVNDGIDSGNAGADLEVSSAVDLGGAASIDIGVDAVADLGSGVVNADVDTGVSLGDTGVEIGADIGAAADLSSGAVDLGISAGVDLGGVGVGVDANVDAGIDLGTGTVDLDVDAGVDLGGATVDTAVEAVADLGSTTTDTVVDTVADLGGTTIDTAVDMIADLGGSVTDTVADLGGGDTAPILDSDTSGDILGGGGLLGGLQGLLGGK